MLAKRSSPVRTERNTTSYPCGGFFFGPTNNEPWYTDCLERTVEQLDRVLKDYDGWAFQYHSSW